MASQTVPLTDAELALAEFAADPRAEVAELAAASLPEAAARAITAANSAMLDTLRACDALDALIEKLLEEVADHGRATGLLVAAEACLALMDSVGPAQEALDAWASVEVASHG